MSKEIVMAHIDKLIAEERHELQRLREENERLRGLMINLVCRHSSRLAASVHGEAIVCGDDFDAIVKEVYGDE